MLWKSGECNSSLNWESEALKRARSKAAGWGSWFPRSQKRDPGHPPIFFGRVRLGPPARRARRFSQLSFPVKILQPVEVRALPPFRQVRERVGDPFFMGVYHIPPHNCEAPRNSWQCTPEFEFDPSPGFLGLGSSSDRDRKRSKCRSKPPCHYHKQACRSCNRRGR
jgi:hypothetical protein